MTTRIFITIFGFGLSIFVLSCCNNSNKNKISEKELELQTNKEIIPNNTNSNSKKNEPNNIVSQIKKPAFKWTKFNLPTSVSNLISLYGNYSKFIPCNLPCDAGSQYTWKISNGLILNAWAMNVGLNYRASNNHKIEAYELTSKNNIVIHDLIFGLSLNKTNLSECKQKFDIKKSDFENAWKFKHKGLYTYLWFNSNGTLIKIGQFPFDYDSVN